ncbi:putative endoglucanase E-4 precursor [Mrakia frigida]|uniref:glycoside hydrolase family 9 protein n=1 Tax=Mrakia frigida TaxID=29902 RepID=UPI003FCC1820
MLLLLSPLCTFLLLLPSSTTTLAQNTTTSSSFWSPPPSSASLPNSTLSPTEQWSNLVGNLIWFYDAQRSGKLDDEPGTTPVGVVGNRVAWRNDSALEDGREEGVDLVGGYYDAGDYLKCTYPLTFVLASISWGAIDFGTAYEKANQTLYLDRMLRYGLDWLIKAHPSASTLFVQVGEGSVDNNYWGGDLTLPLPRPAYQINLTFPGTDAAASASAAFASASFLYSSTPLLTSPTAYSPPQGLANQSYAQTLLGHARELYAFAAGAEPKGVYQKSVPAVKGIYASSGWEDALVWAGLWMALATNESSYYSDALTLYSSSNLSPTSSVFNWDSMTPALPILFTQIALARPGLATSIGIDANLTGWRTVCETMFDGIVEGKGRAKKTSGGLLYYEGDSDAASLNPALNAAMLMLRYAPMASSTAKGESYTTYAQGQIDYVLGNNPMSAPYVVGQNPNSPKNPHSAMAAGGSNIGAIDTDPVVSAYVLYGAVIGGPDKKDRFFDRRSDYVETEIALDYNAPLLTLAAQSLLRLPNTAPFYTTLAADAYSVPPGSPCDEAYPCNESGGLSEAAKIAIAVVVVVVVLGGGLVVGWWWFGWFGGRKGGKGR